MFIRHFQKCLDLNHWANTYQALWKTILRAVNHRSVGARFQIWSNGWRVMSPKLQSNIKTRSSWFFFQSLLHFVEIGVRKKSGNLQKRDAAFAMVANIWWQISWMLLYYSFWLSWHPGMENFSLAKENNRTITEKWWQSKSICNKMCLSVLALTSRQKWGIRYYCSIATHW